MAYCFILKLKTILFFSLSFVLFGFTTRFHLLSLIVICFLSLAFVVTRCYSLPFFVAGCH